MRVIIGRILAVLFVAGLITVFVLFVVGMYNECSCGSRNEEWGDFTVSFYKDRTAAYITGLTEQGQRQKNIVIPTAIDGATVVALGEKALYLGPKLREWHSDKLEKIFLTGYVKIVYGTFDDCPNLEKAISVYGGSFDNTCKQYYANELYLKFVEINPSSKNNIGRANVSYFFNYETDENQGYYWVDDYDYGSKIEYVPDDPVREGYTFGGWYKEEKCVNKWDFERDTLPEEKTELDENDRKQIAYQETALYAKWE